MAKSSNIKVGAKFGKLKICQIAEVERETFLVCRCSCGQTVICHISEIRGSYKTSCNSCADRPRLNKFSPGEIVVYRNAIGELPFGAQAIVNRVIKTERISAVEIEYRGRFYNARPGELESLGVNFYDRRKAKKIR